MSPRFVLELDQEELLAVCKALNVAAYYAPTNRGGMPIHSVFGKATKLLPPGLYDEGSERAQRLLAKVQAGAGEVIPKHILEIRENLSVLEKCLEASDAAVAKIRRAVEVIERNL